MHFNTQGKRRALSVILSIAMLISTAPTFVSAETVDNSGAIITDSTDFDVFLNEDPSYGVEPNTLADKIGGYLKTLIGTENKTYRINTSAATIDPTDLTKWHVYDHYDTQWYANESTWRANYDGRGNHFLPETWYYSSVNERYVNTNGTTPLTIQQLVEKTKGTFGKAAHLREHIYTFGENGKPAMQFYGYSTIGKADFLYYPATKTSIKSVKYDIDASNVQPHSLQFAGFLVNTGTTGTGTSKTISGYLMAIAYTPVNASAGTVANGISSVELYKLNNVNANDLWQKGLKQGNTASLLSGASLVASSSNKPFYKKSHLEMEITPTHLNVALQQLNDSGNLTGISTSLFNTAIDNTGFGGFGPYVDYAPDTGHTCENVSTYRYSNLEMSFKEPVAGTSALEPYQYADYLDKSQNRFFINLTDKTTTNYNYPSAATNLDKAYSNMIKSDQTVLITDEGKGTNQIYPEAYLGNNSKNVYSDQDVTDANVAELYSGTDETELLAAKLAWLIYHNQWDATNAGETPASSSTVVAALQLMDKPADDTTAVQVNSVCKELIAGSGLKVYPDSSKSTNVTATETPVYTLTKPSGETVPLNLEADGSFTVEKDWSIGEYTLTLDYTTTNPAITALVPAKTKFKVLTDIVAPTPSATITNAKTATISFENTKGTAENSYTSNLASYGYLVTDSNTEPTMPSLTDLTAGQASANITLANNLTAGTHYVHMWLKDAAGNLGYAKNSFTVSAPIVSFVEDTSSNTSSNRYGQPDIHVSVTEKTYEVAKVEVSVDNGAHWTALTLGEGGNYGYTLPEGIYTLQARATDTANNASSIISVPVTIKKTQTLTGTESYTFENGIDTTKNFDFKVSGDTSASIDKLGAITYTEKTDSNNIITVSGSSVSINGVGTATVTVAAAETASHKPTEKTIQISVVDPLSVQIHASENAAKTGITVHPTYQAGAYGVADGAVLKYRVNDSSTWTTIENWNWDADTTIPYADLKDYVEYEIVVEAQDNRPTTPHKVSDSYSFRTPDELPQITVSDIKDGILGKSYSDTITATGTAPLTFAITAGKLPDGLLLEPATGVVTGTPTKAGSFTFTVTATNAAGHTAEQQMTVFIATPPTITTASLPSGTRGTAYDQTVVATGDATITYAVTTGTLPAGLSLNQSTGAITGTPTEHGTFNITVTATNAAGTDSKAYTLFIADPPVITTASLPGGTRGMAYNQTVAATGDATITYEVSAGTLPAGLTLAADGTLSGTPTEHGTFNITVTATNAAGTDSKAYTLFIADPPTITTEKLADGIRGIVYAQTVAATGDATITYAVTAGTLPAGLTLAADGRLEGTTTEYGTFHITVTATNAAGNDSKAYTLFIANPPTITTASLPSGTRGTAYNQTVAATGDATITYEVSAGTLPAGLTLAADGTLSGTPTEHGTFDITVSATNTAGTDSKAYTLFVADPPTMTTDKLTDGIRGIAYAQTVAATGDATITYEVSAGTLPAGLTFAADGTLSGTPTEHGTFNITIKATNAAGSDSKAYTLFIANPPVITTEKLADGIRGKSYEFVITADGDIPFSGDITNGKLPNGITFDGNTGLFSGTPTEHGTFNITVTVTNAVGTDNKAYTLFVADPPTITTDKISDGTYGETFEQTLTATGDETITWSVTEGKLPDGLTLDAATGKLSGKATNPGNYTFTVTATNDAGSDSVEFKQFIADPPVIKDQSKDQIVKDNEKVTISVDVDGKDPTYQWQIDRGNGWEDIDDATQKDYSFGLH